MLQIIHQQIRDAIIYFKNLGIQVEEIIESVRKNHPDASLERSAQRKYLENTLKGYSKEFADRIRRYAKSTDEEFVKHAALLACCTGRYILFVYLSGAEKRKCRNFYDFLSFIKDDKP